MIPNLKQTSLLFAMIASLLAGCGGGSDPAAQAITMARPALASVNRVEKLASQPFTEVTATTATTRAPAAQAVHDPLASQIIDVYDVATNTLSIPLVKVGTRFFQDVQIKVGNVISIGQASGLSGVFDTYDIATNRLTVPVVRVGNGLYYNVLVTMGQLLSYGGAVDSISVPTDLAQVSYPQSYQTPTTNVADFNTDPCNLELSRVTYPASWNGQYPLPAVVGAPLKPATGRSVTLKDVGLQPGNPAFILNGAPGAPSGCAGNLQSALAKTMNRLHALGSDYVQVMQWHWASNNPDGSWFFVRAEDTYGSITDSDLAGLVQKAHAAGLKVVMRNQIQGFYPAGHPSETTIPASTPENYAKWFAAYDNYIAERAPFFESLGVDVWELSCAYCMYGISGDGSPATIASFHDSFMRNLDTMKAHYSGKVLMFTQGWLLNTPDLASRVDMLEVGYFGPQPYPAAFNDNLTVAAYRTAIVNNNLQGIINLFDGFGKPIMLSYGIQSRRSLFTLQGYVEETSCTAAFGDLSPAGGGGCLQREVLTDFSMQAIVHEATLEAFNQLNTVHSSLIVNVLDYWETDSLMPYTSFPNIAYSVRSKPAEGIVKAWFAR